jgi:flavin reductase (DIM6/NTAB) family NADH-FMN oxidoreductase RutF
MLFDFGIMRPHDRHKILVSTVLPRPIAWVVTLGDSGRVNVAPFSFFNICADDPPLVMLGIGDGERDIEDDEKDTSYNIRHRREFAISLVDRAHVVAMTQTAIDHPTAISEAEFAGLSLAESHAIKTPRIDGSPASLECRLYDFIELPTKRRIVLGEVLAMHVRDDVVLDEARHHIDSPRMDLVARLHGDGWYVGTRDLFQQRTPR